MIDKECSRTAALLPAIVLPADADVVAALVAVPAFDAPATTVVAVESGGLVVPLVVLSVLEKPETDTGNPASLQASMYPKIITPRCFSVRHHCKNTLGRRTADSLICDSLVEVRNVLLYCAREAGLEARRDRVRAEAVELDARLGCAPLYIACGIRGRIYARR